MYVVIERFGYVNLLKDLNGNVMIFDDFDTAAEWAAAECHDGLVVNLKKENNSE